MMHQDSTPFMIRERRKLKVTNAALMARIGSGVHTTRMLEKVFQTAYMLDIIPMIISSHDKKGKRVLDQTTNNSFQIQVCKRILLIRIIKRIQFGKMITLKMFQKNRRPETRVITSFRLSFNTVSNDVSIGLLI